MDLDFKNQVYFYLYLSVYNLVRMFGIGGAMRSTSAIVVLYFLVNKVVVVVFSSSRGKRVKQQHKGPSHFPTPPFFNSTGSLATNLATVCLKGCLKWFVGVDNPHRLIFTRNGTPYCTLLRKV